MPPLSNGQQITLAVVNLVTCTLSVMGSGFIIYLVVKRKSPTTYNRLLVAMSITEIVNSGEAVFHNFLIPVADDRILAVGNRRTCTALGFFVQFGMTAVTLYSCMLSLNYLLTVRYGMKARYLARYIEPSMHALALLYPLITASVGAGIGVFDANELGSSCWVADDYPKGCVQDDNVPCRSILIGWIFAGFPLIGSLLFLTFSNLSIYLKVRSTITKVNHFADEDAERDHQRREVATQATLYVAACLSCIGWIIAVRTLESMGLKRDDEQSIFWVLLLSNIFSPAQGLWNLLIFIRPRYMRARRRDPDKSRWLAVKQASSFEPSRSANRLGLSGRNTSLTRLWSKWSISSRNLFLSGKKKNSEDLFQSGRKLSMAANEEDVFDEQGGPMAVEFSGGNALTSMDASMENSMDHRMDKSVDYCMDRSEWRFSSCMATIEEGMVEEKSEPMTAEVTS